MSYISKNSNNLSDCNCGLSGTREKYICEEENRQTHRKNIEALWRLNGTGKLSDDDLNSLLNAENFRYNNACKHLKTVNSGSADIYQTNSRASNVRANLMDSPLEERYYYE